MIENEIIDEIHRYRAEHARRCNYDIDGIFAEMRKDLERLKAEGWKVVTPEPRRPATERAGNSRCATSTISDAAVQHTVGGPAARSARLCGNR
jgi:hypothetical protein